MCPPQRGVQLTEVASSQRCIQSNLEMCSPLRGVHLRVMYILQRCPAERDFSLRRVHCIIQSRIDSALHAIQIHSFVKLQEDFIDFLFFFSLSVREEPPPPLPMGGEITLSHPALYDIQILNLDVSHPLTTLGDLNITHKIALVISLLQSKNKTLVLCMIFKFHKKIYTSGAQKRNTLKI